MRKSKRGNLLLGTILFIAIFCICTMIMLFTISTSYAFGSNDNNPQLISSGNIPNSGWYSYSIYRIKIDNEFKYFMTTYSSNSGRAISTIQID